MNAKLVIKGGAENAKEVPSCHAKEA